MINVIVVLVIAVLSLVGVKRQPARQGLSLEQGNCIKGIAAVLLVLVHIQLFLPKATAYTVLSAGGYLFVGTFFFYSGYGITKKAVSSNINMKKQLQRIIKLFIMVVVTEIIYLAASIFLFNNTYTVKEIIHYVLGVELLNGAMWYIVALIIIYCVLLITSRFRLKCVTRSIIACVVYCIICLLRERPVHELQSCIAFIIGVYIAENPDVYLEIVNNKKKRNCAFILSTTGFILSNILTYGIRYFWDDFFVVRFVFGSISTSSFVALLMLLLSVIRIDNCIIRFLGNISTEIYLSHILILNIIENYFPEAYKADNTIFISLVILSLTILVSFLVKSCLTLLKRKGTK